MAQTPLELYRTNRKLAYKQVLSAGFWDAFANWAEKQQQAAQVSNELIRGLHQACYGGDYPGPVTAIEQLTVYIANLHEDLKRLRDGAAA